MDPQLTGQALAEHTMRLCRLAVALREGSTSARQASRATRAKTREYLQERVRLAKTLRKQFISRRLLTGRLPRASAAAIVGGPGAGGSCGGCDKPLTSAQLVMAIPSGEQTFVHLHAECFMIWDAMRPRAGERKIS